jgi:hypothetical protein
MNESPIIGNVTKPISVPPAPPAGLNNNLDLLENVGTPSMCKKSKHDSSDNSDWDKKFKRTSKKEKKDCICNAKPCTCSCGSTFNAPEAITLERIRDIDHDLDDLDHDVCQIKSEVGENHELLKDVLS